MQGRRSVVYYHIMFESHQIVFANGAGCESFYPGAEALRALGSGERSELCKLFPALRPKTGQLDYGPTARPFARFHALPDRLCALSLARPRSSP
ncbi:Hint domain-containing protein [Rhodovulum tesquicola]|uniref:Hint domain-containing protein n=1 Tax=Rhodovulum tesquicola TaxID=540254 RepID=UPI00209755AA|nr:Hint domain-containing protein [Rhodovulum tesquicola]MCO8146823.1 Hint domain-containing protein [Rhodovulum tesquicola]